MSEFNIGKKIKTLRLSRNLTLRAVAKETGFSVALLSQIENDNVSPPIATLSRIARFFDVKIGEFFSDGEEECSFEVLRKSQRNTVPRVISRDGTSHGYFYEALSVAKRNKRMDPFLLTLNDKVTNTDTYSHNGEEFVFVLQGTAEMRLDEQTVILNEGDCVYFDSNVKHRLLSRDGAEVKVLAVVLR